MIRRSNIFLSLTILFLLLAGGALCFIPKGEFHLLLSEHHTAAADFFFRYYTQVGEWVPYVVAAGLVFYKAGWSIFTLVSILLTGLASQGLKYLADTDRPYLWFAEHMPDIQLTFVEGVHLSKFYSFPSGHTTTFFALFLALCMIVSETNIRVSNQRLLQILFFCFALLGGYSRIYLNQHFLEDVIGGAIIGTTITLLLALAIPYLQGYKWWNWNLNCRKMHFF